MAVYTAKLSVQDAAFPLLSRYSGKPVIIPNVDSNPTNEPTAVGFASNVSSIFNDVAKPHILYCENVLPRSGGFSSVGFTAIKADIGVNPQNAYTLQIRNMNNALKEEEYCTAVFFKGSANISYHTANLDGTATTGFTKADIISQGNSGGIQFVLSTFNAIPSQLQLQELRINTAGTAVELSAVYNGSTLPPAGISLEDFQDCKFCCAACNYLILAKPDGTLFWNNPTMGQYLPVAAVNLFTIGNVITGSTSNATATLGSTVGSIGLHVGATTIGTFASGETVTSTGVQLTVTAVAGFTVGETITGSNSGATATYVSSTGATGLNIGGNVTGAFVVGDVITGSTSHNTDTVSALGSFTPSTTITGIAVDAPDYTPSLQTGAGSEIPAPMSGTCIGLQSLGDGFIVHTTTGDIFGRYSQNAQFPWTFVPVWNSVPVNSSVVNTMLAATDNFIQYQQFVWTKSGLMELSVIQNAISVAPEVSDFLGAQLLEAIDSNGVPAIQTPGSVNAGVIDVALARIGNRYLCISYGQITDAANPYFTQILVQDLHLKRWGKLVINHIAVVPLPNAYDSIADLHDIGIIGTDGSIYATTEQLTNTVKGVLQTVQHNGILIMGGISFVRGNVSGVNSIAVNYGNIVNATDPNAESIAISYSSSVDAMNLAPFVPLTVIASTPGSLTCGVRNIAPYHYFKVRGYFHISELEVKLFKGGNR